METHQQEGNAPGKSNQEIADEVMSGLQATLAAVGVIMGLLIPLAAGLIKIATGDYVPGIIFLLFAGFVLSMLVASLNKRYRGQLVVLGISLLVILGIIWAIFEDGYGPKAFMLALVITAGFMAALGFYNVFLKKRQPHMPG